MSAKAESKREYWRRWLAKNREAHNARRRERAKDPERQAKERERQKLCRIYGKDRTEYFAEYYKRGTACG